MSQASASSLSTDDARVIFFPEGHGFVFNSVLADTGTSNVTIVRSLNDGEYYVRKQSEPDFIAGQGIIQSAEVRIVKILENIAGIPELIGWTEYQDEYGSNYFINASYWKLYNGGTLEELKSNLQTKNRSLPEDCAWSMLAQILGVMIHTIRSGTLNADGHMGNWYIQIRTGTTPKVILGDWGRIESRPTHHAQECTNSTCSNTCSVKTWWISCSDKLKLFVASHIRDLAATPGCSSESERNKDIERRLPYLNTLLKVIEEYPASGFPTGEQWFANIERLKVLIMAVQENNSRYRPTRLNTSTVHDFLRRQLPTHPPPFSTARSQILDPDSSIPCFARSVVVDPRTGDIIAVEGSHERLGYEDYTEYSGLSSEWLNDHDWWQQKIRSLESQVEQTGYQGGSRSYGDRFGGAF